MANPGMGNLLGFHFDGDSMAHEKEYVNIIITIM